MEWRWHGFSKYFTAPYRGTQCWCSASAPEHDKSSIFAKNQWKSLLGVLRQLQRVNWPTNASKSRFRPWERVPQVILDRYPARVSFPTCVLKFIFSKITQNRKNKSFSMKSHRFLLKSMKILVYWILDFGFWILDVESIEINGNLWKSMKINENHWILYLGSWILDFESMEIYENQWKSLDLGSWIVDFESMEIN